MGGSRLNGLRADLAETIVPAMHRMLDITPHRDIQFNLICRVETNREKTLCRG
ncbi:MAG TPA: hypothetical protein VMY43_04705 [Methanothrix sp.]|nr:hypothetical protein [Methanothrix sp.]